MSKLFTMSKHYYEIFTEKTGVENIFAIYSCHYILFLKTITSCQIRKNFT